MCEGAGTPFFWWTGRGCGTSTRTRPSETSLDSASPAASPTSSTSASPPYPSSSLPSSHAELLVKGSVCPGRGGPWCTSGSTCAGASRTPASAPSCREGRRGRPSPASPSRPAATTRSPPLASNRGTDDGFAAGLGPVRGPGVAGEAGFRAWGLCGPQDGRLLGHMWAAAGRGSGNNRLQSPGLTLESRLGVCLLKCRPWQEEIGISARNLLQAGRAEWLRCELPEMNIRLVQYIHHSVTPENTLIIASPKLS